jgi:hypothetical protein
MTLYFGLDDELETVSKNTAMCNFACLMTMARRYRRTTKCAYEFQQHLVLLIYGRLVQGLMQGNHEREHDS